MMLDDYESSTNVTEIAPVAQRTEQRFPKTKFRSQHRRRSIKTAAKKTNSLESGTDDDGSSAGIFSADEYTGKRLKPLWDLAKRTQNTVLRDLVLRFEAEREGIAIQGRRSA